jgi:hypothetical protein
MVDLSPLTHAALASIATYALIKGPTESKEEGFAIDCKSTKATLKKKAADCTKADLGTSVKEADLVAFCKKKANSGKKVCQGVATGKTPSPGKKKTPSPGKKKTPSPGGAAACSGNESFKAKINKGCTLTGTDLENACTKDSKYSNKNLVACKAFASKCSGMTKSKKYDMCNTSSSPPSGGGGSGGSTSPSPSEGSTSPSPSNGSGGTLTPPTSTTNNPPTNNPPTNSPPSDEEEEEESSEYTITVKIGEVESEFEITDEWTVQELVDAIAEDEELSPETGLLGLGRFGLVNFKMIVDEDEDEPVTEFGMDDVLVELGDIGDDTIIEIQINNTIPYAIIAGILLLCSALIGLLVYYFMYMEGGY